MNTSIKTALAAIGLLVAFSCKKENSNLQSPTATNVSDVVTGKYPSVLIGTQRWMTKNLDVSHYQNGDAIPEVTDGGQWKHATTGAWCWYKNDSAKYSVYGKLYNWYAVHDPRGLAPAGWHVASNAEWDTLSTYLGGDPVAGGKLKDTGTIEAGTGLWYAPNYGASNKSGFTALPGGDREPGSFDLSGGFKSIGYYGHWWTSTRLNHRDGWYRTLSFNDRKFGSVYPASKIIGFSIRCVHD